MALSCDGVPYMLMRKVIHSSKIESAFQKFKEFGWIDTAKMTMKDLKTVLRKKNLATSGVKADLIARVKDNINQPILQKHLHQVSLEGEFDWLVPYMGGLHQQFM